MTSESVPTNTKCPACGYVTADPFNCVMCADGFARFVAESPENFDPRERSMARAYLALRATPRAGSASKERGFFEWSCGCSLNNGLVTPCATHASPAAAPREHPSPEPYCASCDAREGEPCPHNVIQCARPRRAHPPRAVPDETRCEKCGLTQAGHILDGACLAFAHPTDRRYPCGCLIGARNGRVKLVEVCDVDRTADESHLPSPSAAHPPRAGDVTEEMVERALAYDASTWPSEKPWSEKAKADGRAYYRGLLTAALRGEAKG